MNIWLFSSGDGDDNEHADEELVSEFDTDRPLLTFIPSSADDYEDYYDEFIDRFQRHAYCKFRLMDVDLTFSKRQLKQTLESDLIYLSGGNTYYFLKHIRESGFDHELREFIARGGILAGHSAGAIVLSPNINTAGFPEEDRDDNDVGLVNMKAMNIFDFEVFPHYEDLHLYNNALREYTRQSGSLVYALEDGAAVHLLDYKTSFYGEVYAFFAGKKVKLEG